MHIYTYVCILLQSYDLVLLAMTWPQEVIHTVTCKGQSWVFWVFCTNLKISLWNFFGNFFYSKVQPVLLYAADIWGLEDDYCYEIEKQQHTFALQRFHQTIWYRDTARYPLYINTYVHAVRYWLKITNVYHTKPLLMLLHLNEQGKSNWVTKIRATLFRFGLGYVWQGSQFVKSCFRHRLTDNRWQDWNQTNASDRFNLYRQFKTNHVQAVYLSVDITKYMRNSLIKFRFSVSPIAVHSLRYKMHAYIDNI